MKQIIRLQMFLLAVAVAALSQTALAQTAQLTGSVTDSNSAVINGAMVTAENLNTGWRAAAFT